MVILGMTESTRVRLLKPLRRALRRGHPWVYRDALARISVSPGTVVTVVDDRDRFIARGWADEGPIAVRVLTTRDEPVDADLLGRRIQAAARLRDTVVPAETDAYRLIHGEGDRMPGLVCDVYGAFATLSLDGAAATSHRDQLVEVLYPVLEARGVRGLVARTGRRIHQRREVVWGEAPPPQVLVREGGMVMCADLLEGQKTGLFLDHRLGRRLARRIAPELRVLDLYANVGGFSAAAGLGGATAVVTVDSAPAAIEGAARTWRKNGLDASRQTCVVADVQTFVQAQAEAGHRFDLIIADPPSFAPSHAARAKALRAYTRLHQSCITLLAPGGYYLGASCSSHVDRIDFEATLVEGADKARRNVQLLERWGPPPDHPRLLGFPEGDYLKVALCKAVD